LKGVVIVATFKERFLLLQKEKDESLDKLAEIFHTNKSSLSRMINGHLNVKKDLLEDIANYFGCSTDFLLGNTDIRNKNDNPIVKESESIYKVDPDMFITMCRAKNLPDSERQKIKEYAAMLLEKHLKEQNK
jgi:transcriptional regulator with XRE-family HTH domain